MITPDYKFLKFYLEGPFGLAMAYVIVQGNLGVADKIAELGFP
jgi:hypothetical protein